MRKYVSPLLLIPCRFTLPPEPVCFGTKPVHAANSRPERNAFGSPIIATAAVRRSKVGAFCEVKYGLDLKLNARPYVRQCISDKNQWVEIDCEVKM